MNVYLNFVDLYAMSPFLILMIGSLLILLIETFGSLSIKKYSSIVTLIILILTFYTAYFAPESKNPLLTSWIKFDYITRFFNLFFTSVGFACVLLSSALFKQFKSSEGEFYFLLLSALFGLFLISSSTDFLTLFIGIETLSIALYVLCGYMKKWEISHESSVKYFLTGALAAALFVYGVAFIYGALGTTSFNSLLKGYQGLDSTTAKILFWTGIALVTGGLAFKAAIVPLHIWAPDVYEGASTPVTAFMSVATKAGAFAAFIRIFFLALPQFSSIWNQGISFLIYLTLIYANFVALRQTHLRRFFAYSGISHAGFLLILCVVGTSQALQALLFYLVVYAFATIGSFAVLTFLDQRIPGVVIYDLKGLFYKSPFLALILSMCLLTLAGIPPTAGFFAKFYLFKITYEAGYYGLVVVGLLTSILAAFYYLRILSIMLDKPEYSHAQLISSKQALFVGIACLASLLLLSFYPDPLLNSLLPS